jgi:hypothetical protein
MSRRGIASIFCGESIINLKPESNPKVPTFTKTTLFDVDKERKSKRWERLEEGEDIQKILSEYGSDIVRQKISGMKINGKIVDLTDLYSFDGDAFCIFKKEKSAWSDKMNILSLLVVGSKTARELEVVGYTKSKSSYLPLLLCDNKGSITMLNGL